jgi:hypothetical protein
MPRNDNFEMSDIISNNGRNPEEDVAFIGTKHANGSARRRSVAGGLYDTQSGPLTTAEARLAERGFLRRSLSIILLIASWLILCFSVMYPCH